MTVQKKKKDDSVGISVPDCNDEVHVGESSSFLTGAHSSRYIIWLECKRKTLFGHCETCKPIWFLWQILVTEQQPMKREIHILKWKGSAPTRKYFHFTFQNVKLFVDGHNNVSVKGKCKASLEKEKHFSGKWSWWLEQPNEMKIFQLMTSSCCRGLSGGRPLGVPAQPSMPNRLHCQDHRTSIPSLYHNGEAAAANGAFGYRSPFYSTSVALNGT